MAANEVVEPKKNSSSQVLSDKERKEKELEYFIKDGRMEILNAYRLQSIGVTNTSRDTKRMAALTERVSKIDTIYVKAFLNNTLGLDSDIQISIDYKNRMLYAFNLTHNSLIREALDRLNGEVEPVVATHFFSNKPNERYIIGETVYGFFAQLQNARARYFPDENQFCGEFIHDDSSIAHFLVHIRNYRTKLIDTLQQCIMRLETLTLDTPFDDNLVFYTDITTLVSVLINYIDFLLGSNTLGWRDGDNAMEVFIAIHDYLQVSVMGEQFYSITPKSDTYINQMTTDQLLFIKDLMDVAIKVSDLSTNPDMQIIELLEFYGSKYSFIPISLPQYVSPEEIASTPAFSDIMCVINLWHDRERTNRFTSHYRKLHDLMVRLIKARN